MIKATEKDKQTFIYKEAVLWAKLDFDESQENIDKRWVQLCELAFLNPLKANEQIKKNWYLYDLRSVI